MRHRTHAVTNTHLADALARTGRTYAACAAEVRKVAAEAGHIVQYDASTVGHWLTGRVPPPAVRPLVVEAFARLLGTPTLRAADLGWADSPWSPPPAPWDGEPADHLAALGADDMHRRAALAAGAYTLAALTLPTTATANPSRGGVRVSPADAARIRATTDRLADLDDQFGGGHVRPMIGAYLTAHVAPLLHAATGPGRDHVFAAAAELAYLAGWCSADDRRDAAAQRYYIQAARLADEAGNPVMRASALRSLAVQALELGHPNPALDLADAAAATARGHCPVRQQAWITGMQAEAHAAAGNGSAARAGLHAAERGVARADSPTGCTGGYVTASWQHQTGLALAHLGDLTGAETHLTAAAGNRGPTENRTRALIGIRLATVQVRRGHPDTAAATVTSLTGDLTAVDCARVRTELAALRTSWQPHRRHPTVSAADELVRALGKRA